jgi:beta-glucosidase
MEAGNAIADVLTGKSYPSGKLTVTFPKDIYDVPSTKNFPNEYTFWEDIQLSNEQKKALPHVAETRYEEGMNVGYRYFQTENKEVSYPFGFGLSYTKFEYSNAKLQRKGDGYVASVNVKNIGDKAGKEVVQLYITAPKGNMPKPAIELRAFGKTRELKPGESQRVEMTFSYYDIASYDVSQQAYITDAGSYDAHFAASATDIRQTLHFKTDKHKWECHDVMRPNK